jgi:hypothetical protein
MASDPSWKLKTCLNMVASKWANSFCAIPHIASLNPPAILHNGCRAMGWIATGETAHQAKNVRSQDPQVFATSALVFFAACSELK